MKSFIKLFGIAIALLACIGVNAQNKPLTFGVKAGMNLANFSGNGSGDSKAKVGFNVGITLDYLLDSNIYLLTGLELTTKGAKEEVTVVDGNVSYKATEKANPMYLQLPVHVGYKVLVNEDLKIVIHAGPYIAYGIGGKAKMEYKLDNVKISEDYDFFGSDAAKAFDFGLGIGAGVELGKINAGIGYDFGLVNMTRNNVNLKNMNAYLSVGYKF